jgi:3-isopropylmalate dehydrogenase
LYAIGVVYDHEFILKNLSRTAIDKTGTSLPQQTLNLCLNTDAVLFGAVGPSTIIIRHCIASFSRCIKIRKELGLLQMLDQSKHILHY